MLIRMARKIILITLSHEDTLLWENFILRIKFSTVYTSFHLQLSDTREERFVVHACKPTYHMYYKVDDMVTEIKG